jgi:osmotically inducible protein OsmC
VRTSADVTLEKLPDGFAITGIALTSQATVPGADAAQFQQIAEDTKKGCPVSKALAATPITLKASLG